MCYIMLSCFLLQPIRTGEVSFKRLYAVIPIINVWGNIVICRKNLMKTFICQIFRANSVNHYFLHRIFGLNGRDV